MSVLNTVSPGSAFAAERSRLVAAHLAEGRPDGTTNAYAQITARCSQKNQHAFALMLKIARGRVVHVSYAKGGAKVQNLASSPEVETAVACFCDFARGKTVKAVLGAGLPALADHFGLDDSEIVAGQPSFPTNPAEQEDLLLRLGEPLFSLFVGGAIPFVLFNWAVLNHEIKRAVTKTVGGKTTDPVRLRGVDDVRALMKQLSAHPLLGRRARGLEIGIRSLHLNTVDESSLRTAYQRDTLPDLLAAARERGFWDQFEAVS